MGDGRILLKPRYDDSFKKVLSNEPYFARILAGQYLQGGKILTSIRVCSDLCAFIFVLLSCHIVEDFIPFYINSIQKVKNVLREVAKTSVCSSYEEISVNSPNKLNASYAHPK
jgi:hypothetical protein